jgi:fatty acid desaturase
MTINTDRAAILRKYRFPAEMKAQLRPLYRLDNWHGPLAWAQDALWVGLAITASSITDGHGLAFWIVYLTVSVPVIATRQRALATLLHESAHKSLAKNPRLNRLLGTYLSGYLIGQTFDAYFASHVRDHHGRFGDLDRDPDLRSHVQAGLYDHQSTGAFAARFLVAPLFFSQIRLVRQLVTSRTVYQGSSRGEAARMLGYLVLLAALAAHVSSPQAVLLYWVVPLTVVFPPLNWYIEILEHFPLPLTAGKDLQATRHRALSWFSRHFFGIHNEGFHLDHHLSPGIPFWNLPRVHAIRLADPAYRQLVQAQVPDRSWPLIRQFTRILSVDRPHYLGSAVPPPRTSTRRGSA